MKIKFYLLFLFSVLFTTFQVQANIITVKGYVKSANGSPVKNAEVKIAAYLNAATTSCSELVTVTNGDGFYSKELSCTGDINKSRISVVNCDGKLLTQDKEVPATKIIEANFSICIPTPAPCAAVFTAEVIPASSTAAAFSVKFNSSSSQVSNKDSIIHRTWDFHDGTALLNDRVDPTHSFPHDGTYEVCFTIKTSSGCESKVCKQIVIPPVTPVVCTSKFTFEKLGPKKFRFNSSISTVAANDNLLSRKWDFGDGTVSDDASPAHEFARTGTYEVCLTIKTAKGCESRSCVAVKSDEPVPSDNDPIKVVSLYPIPVHENLMAVVYSKNNNIQATISVLDIYGKVQLSQQVTLYPGNNSIKTRVFTLPPGSYYFKITTSFGTISKAFYKI